MAEKSDKFFALIDRLKVCSEKKYPERKWTEEFYQYTSFIWIGLESELETRVLKLENELQISTNIK